MGPWENVFATRRRVARVDDVGRRRGARVRGHWSRGQDISGREGVHQVDGGGGARAGDVGNRMREIRRREIREMILCVVVDVIVVDG